MKSAARYAGKDLEAMKATAQAQKERSLEMFKETLKEYQDREYLYPCVPWRRRTTDILFFLLSFILSELQKDPLIRSHLSALFDTLLEQNLLRVIEPYSSVELSWIAHEVGQSRDVVEEK